MNVTNDPNLTSWIDSANEAGCDFPSHPEPALRTVHRRR